jgi:lambda family phage portal protein
MKHTNAKTPTMLDRVVAAVAPRVAVKRFLARQAFDGLSKRAYDGAASGRRTDGWRSGGISADAEIASAGAILRNRMRDLVRNNPHAAKAVSAWVSNIVGSGITPRAASGNAALDKKINTLLDAWSNVCDADGRNDFYGLQTLAVSGMVEAGEIFARRRIRRASDGLPVPLQIQLNEADHLDESKIDGRLEGGRTVRGIAYDALGRRTGYWLFPDHPGDIAVPLSRGFSSVLVPADGVIHLYRRDRVQQRGVPWGAPVMRALRDLDDWTNAELARKKTEACLVGIVTGGDDADQGVAPSVIDADGKTIEQFEPGLIAYARGGKDIKFNQPAATAGVSEWLRAQLHIIAAGFRIPYELLTGDLSQVNYSSIRAGIVEFRRIVEAIQWQVVIPVFCQPIWDWFTEAAFVGGLVPQPRIPVKWSPPRFEYLNPLDDARADLMMMRMGATSLPRVVGRQGEDLDDILAEIAGTNAKLDASGIILDSDPRKVSQQGLFQQEAKADTGDEPVKPKPAKKKS